MMKRKSKKESSLYAALAPALLTGDEKIIQEAKKNYLRAYKAAWRREKRKKEKEITTSWKPEEITLLSREAKRHRTSITAFVKKCTLAYLDKRYIVPEQKLVLKIAQLLAMTYNSIADMMENDNMPKVILEKVSDLEKQVLSNLHSPKTIEQVVTEAIRENPNQRTILLKLLDDN